MMDANMLHNNYVAKSRTPWRKLRTERNGGSEGSTLELMVMAGLAGALCHSSVGRRRVQNDRRGRSSLDSSLSELS